MTVGHRLEVAYCIDADIMMKNQVTTYIDETGAYRCN